MDAANAVTMNLNLRVYGLSRSGKERMVRRFDHEGLRQLQKLLLYSEKHSVRACSCVRVYTVC